MEQKNGYFYLMHKNDGTYLKLIPNQIGGDRIKIDDLRLYLAEKRIVEEDTVALVRAVNNLYEVQEVKLTSQMIMPEKESMSIQFSPDGLTATAKFYAPSEQGALMNRNDIISVAVAKGMKFGLIEEVIDEFLANRVYCTNIVIAKALLPVEGSDARVIYHFNNTVTRKPKMNEDGSVDFHQLELINHIKKGDLLAELVPMVPGKPGIDVFGKLIKQKPVHNCILKHGPKSSLSEDGMKLFSEVEGHVYLSGDKVMVSDVYEIHSDIDLSTGDVDYAGSVMIKGNVRTGFTVKARGTIFVEGVVEGATLISDAGIVLSRGMQGMNRGKLCTSGDVVAKFIENAVVECDGSLTAEAILHSKVYAGKEINVTGKKGFVTGGELHSGLEIRAKTVGSTMGTNTVLEVGVDPKVILEYHNTEKRISEKSEELNKLEKILELFHKKYGAQLPQDKILTYHMTKESYDKCNQELESAMERYSYLESIIEMNDSGSIYVEKTIYSGCKIVISNVVYYVRSDMFCKHFVKDNVDIKIYDFTT